MYAVYKTLHPPTGLEHCLYTNVISSTEKHLVVAGVNQLHFYRITEELFPKNADKSSEQKQGKQKMECVFSFSLFGNITSLASVRLSGRQYDSLLLSFSEAKLSVVEYDQESHDLKTISLHFFEEEYLKEGCLNIRHFIPTIRVDPEDRCAAMLIYGNKLAVLPFVKEISSEDADSSFSSSRTGSFSSYIIDLYKMDEKISHVIDIQFLYGYYEPTLLILYEPLPTWTGRVAVRKDSCSIVAISLNMQEKVHPVIWSVSQLPYDCMGVLPIEKPIGGVVVYAVNSLFYMNQSTPPYGVSLNSSVSFSTDFQLKPQEGVKIMLDAGRLCAMGSDKFIISLKSGELYVVTLVIDDMRLVRNFHMEKSASSVITTALTMCNSNFLFLASRLGNSLLLRCAEKQSEEIVEEVQGQEGDEKQSKEEAQEQREKTENIGDWIAGDVSQIDDPEELEVYGERSSIQSDSAIVSFSFEVCDSILNIGPCSHSVIGEPAFLSEEFNNAAEPDLELVTASGYNKNGALCILQRSIRPQIVTTFTLPGCIDMWTVYSPQSEAHSLLILSKEESSMILETGQEIMELEHSGFITNQRTIHAGNIGNDNYILQVCLNIVVLLQETQALQKVPLETLVRSCTVADPFALVLHIDGTLTTLELQDDGATPRLAVIRTPMRAGDRIMACCSYIDHSGLFSANAPSETDLQKQAQTDLQSNKSFVQQLTIDEEDELLYRESDAMEEQQHHHSSFVNEALVDSPSENVKEIQPTFWGFLVRDEGTLEIVSLPDFQSVFYCTDFINGPRILRDSALDDPTMNSNRLVLEVCAIGLGVKQRRPIFFVRCNGLLLVYEAFYFGNSEVGRLKLRFKKLKHEILQEKENSPRRQMVPFEDISGYSGIFICGVYPYWIFVSTRGILRVHPLSIDGPITCFASFHNINCPRGFLYFNSREDLRISLLPTHLSYDSTWPVRKVPLRCSAYMVVYHRESQTYTVVTSMPEPCTKVVKIQNEGEKVHEAQERDSRFVLPPLERFNIQLFSPVSWEAIPNTRVEFEDFEHVTCVKHVVLKSEGTVSGLKGYIAVATNYSYNEDVTSRGKILIYDVIEVVPEPGQPLTKNRMKIEYHKEQKGPMTALDHVNGFLITAIGQKIYIWMLKEGDLSGVAFIDTQVYIHRILTIKNLILVGDVCKNVMLLRYQEQMKVLSLVSRAMRPMQIYACDFIIDNTTLSFMASDHEENLIIYGYMPELKESSGGTKLVQRADINIGSRVNTMFRVKTKLMDPSTGRKMTGTIARRQVTYVATLDGGLAYVLPISEKTYRRLLMVQNALTTHIPHIAGLNPKMYRLLRHQSRLLVNPAKNVLDGDLLWMFLMLSESEQCEIAKRIGTVQEQIIEELMEIDKVSAHF